MPSELQRIVRKALRKDRNQRYQVMQELLLDVRALRDDAGSEADIEVRVTEKGVADRGRRCGCAGRLGFVVRLVFRRADVSSFNYSDYAFPR